MTNYKKPILILTVLMGFFLSIVTFLAFVFAESETTESRISRDFGISNAQSVKLSNIFKEVGMDDYYSAIEKIGMLQEYDRFFNVNTKDAEGVLVYITNDLSKVRVTYNAEILYKDDMVKGNLLDSVITSEEEVHYKTYAEKHIKSVLLSPDTAEFPLYDGWKFGKIDGEVVVQGYVDAQNAFGSVIRSNFQLKYKAGTCTSLIIDGKEYIKL